MSADTPFALLPLETQAARFVVALNADGQLQARSQEVLRNAFILALADYEPTPGGFHEEPGDADISQEGYLFLFLFTAVRRWLTLLEPGCQLDTRSAIQTVLTNPIAAGAFHRLYPATREPGHFTAAMSCLLKAEDRAVHRAAFEQAGAWVWPIEGASTA